MRKRSSGRDDPPSLRNISGPCSVYLHIPFCLRKCPYCSFYSIPAKQGEVDGYLRLLEREMASLSSAFGPDVRAETLYIGGGTPTMLQGAQWITLLRCLKRYIPMCDTPEFTVEANPDSLTEEHLELWKTWGVTRVSIGVQSFSDDDLRFLCRPHDADRAKWALSASVRAGFSVSADLIFGLRGQTLRSWKQSLGEAIRLGANHLSLYQLSIERGCTWYRKPPGALPEGYPFYRWSQWYLPKKGFEQYEIASFAPQGGYCRHNLSYWTGSPVIGLGAGAWGCLQGIRYKNPGNIREYAQALEGSVGSGVRWKPLSKEARAREAAVLLLRTRWGIRFSDFAATYGERALETVVATLKDKVPESCLEWREKSVALTPRGMRVGNAIWSMLI